MTVKKCPCVFNVPLVHNNGTPVISEIGRWLRQSLDRQFGGYTEIGNRAGSWKGNPEDHQWIVVLVIKEDVPKLREIVIELGRRTKQEAMYFEEGLPTVEIIPIDEE
jgi:hypothetical protein